ncbi:multicopper oxidase family protein [Leucobacter aridicollis]|uniref:FtsP/CotA-like multicopper oxidase with cupredoxin domain n=1 Tax=Leucobacter aridicollis TaxID=283878 RepID=A0A852QYM1_9MICO|nr:multicopper oxidase family protein [Leucobacter aridicollis]MBL3683436.1 multicopper oxidase family protein [Leucobacter aridicollis]NYD25257.1 FtsP/CotA-like multicopper oxidase with cupredoxin domain [Leucobacter aridicollis]
MDTPNTTHANTDSTPWVRPDGPEAEAVERARRTTGASQVVSLVAEPVTLDIAGTAARTWGYRGERRPIIRARPGDELVLRLQNLLPEPTSLHWHGLALRNDADGAPPVAGAGVAPGQALESSFIVPHAGTHWFHSHSGLQSDRGLFGTLIVDDPEDRGAIDAEWILVLDDWLDGLGATPDDVFAEFSAGMSGHGDHGAGHGAEHGTEHGAGHGEHAAGHGGHAASQGEHGAEHGDGQAAPMRDGFMLMGTYSDELGEDTGDVFYPEYLINDRPAADPAVFAGKPGDRVRLRVVNAGGDTAFRLAIGGHRLTVTHSDGYPVQPRETGSVLIGMGERVDLLVTLGDGAFPIVAEAEGKGARGFAVLRTAAGQAPAADAAVPELHEALALDRLLAAPSAALPERQVDREVEFAFTGSMAAYDWGVNGRRFDEENPLADAMAVRSGERVRLLLHNDTTMWHPFHIHGHTGQLGRGGARKDTVVVRPGQRLTLDFDADNPGLWPAHCHNAYHMAAGMMAVIGYRTR